MIFLRKLSHTSNEGLTFLSSAFLLFPTPLVLISRMIVLTIIALIANSSFGTILTQIEKFYKKFLEIATPWMKESLIVFWKTLVNRVKTIQYFLHFCTLTLIIITFLSFELQKWFSSQNRSEFNQEFNSELTFLLDLTSLLIPRGTKVPLKYRYGDLCLFVSDSFKM